MGRFVNPGNSAFMAAIRSEIYVDKSMLLDYTNKVLGTTQAFICNSRPRRFGKSITADMLTAYYSIGCDSTGIFDNLSISSTDNYQKHLNNYNVIHLDVQWCMEPAKKPENVISFITQSTLSELNQLYPDILTSDITSLPDALSRINLATSSQFIIIIDEWDVLIRDESSNEKIQTDYINFLRGLFKGSEPTKYIALAFLTGMYLGYNEEKETAFVPNEELRLELIKATKQNKWNDFIMFQQKSYELLDATLDLDEHTVAECIENIHNNYTPAITYNNENSLSSVLSIAYLSTMQYYFKPKREYPTGHGFADFVYFPKPEYINEYPVLIIELKWNQDAKTAIKQIKEKKYPESLTDYTGKLLLVGINYDKKTKNHECMIEKFQL